MCNFFANKQLFTFMCCYQFQLLSMLGSEHVPIIPYQTKYILRLGNYIVYIKIQQLII